MQQLTDLTSLVQCQNSEASIAEFFDKLCTQVTHYAGVAIGHQARSGKHQLPARLYLDLTRIENPTLSAQKLTIMLLMEDLLVLC